MTNFAWAVRSQQFRFAHVPMSIVLQDLRAGALDGAKGPAEPENERTKLNSSAVDPNIIGQTFVRNKSKRGACQVGYRAPDPPTAGKERRVGRTTLRDPPPATHPWWFTQQQGNLKDCFVES